MRGITVALHNASAYLIALGRYEDARARSDEVLELSRTFGYPELIGPALRHIALLVALKPRDEMEDATADYAGAGRLLGFLASNIGTIKANVRAGATEFNDALAAIRTAIGEQDLNRLMSAGATMTKEQAL